jgi:hypothetical protein
MRMDLARYKTHTGRLDLTGIDFDRFASEPLSPDALRCLRYMHDIENHTACYLRDLLVTPAHRDPDITTFLSCWNFEESWHGDALARVLEAHGDQPEGRVEALRGHLGWKDRLAPVAHLAASAAVGYSYIAVHMTWGAINEWTTQAGYARLAARADHPVLRDLLRRIMRQEGRHIDFYASEAERRLTRDRRARRITRFALRRVWRPVGASVMPEREVAFLVRYLFGDGDGRAMARRIDRHVDRLPGQSGLALVEGAVDRWAPPVL